VIRKEKKHLTTDLDAPIIEFNHASEHFGKISPEEITQWLMEALETLPEKQRLVFEYKYFEDLKYEEIAKLTGGSVGGLKANYFHAVGKIEAFLKLKLNH
jgi:RNA polymerase sigma-70 factor (ECF subfamily)